MKHGLSAETVAAIHGVFDRHPAVEKAVLYGSRAKGNYQNGSDIDLTLFGEGLNDGELMNLIDELDELLLPFTIDLSIYARLDQADLREHIQRVGVVFYTRKLSEQNGGGK